MHTNLLAKLLAAMTVAAAGLLTGCTAGAAQPAPATTAPTTTASTGTAAPVTQPKTLTRGQAAKRYLEIIAPVNALYDEAKCEQAWNWFSGHLGTWPPDDHPEWDDKADEIARDCYKRGVPRHDKMIKDLQATLWPVDAQGDVADLVSQDQAHLHCFKLGARAATSDAMYKVAECFPPDDGGAADRVRARFGLPIRSS